MLLYLCYFYRSLKSRSGIIHQLQWQQILFLKCRETCLSICWIVYLKLAWIQLNGSTLVTDGAVSESDWSIWFKLYLQSHLISSRKVWILPSCYDHGHKYHINIYNIVQRARQEMITLLIHLLIHAMFYSPWISLGCFRPLKNISIGADINFERHVLSGSFK
jgi:hypothetical protein